MALIRPVRIPPIKPTGAKLRKLMWMYGLRRHVVARLMRVHPRAVGYYLYPEGHVQRRRIPQAAWELLLMKVQAIYHPDEDIDLPL